jgi:hypothetical protein
VGFDAHIGNHAAQDHLRETVLSQLQHHIIGSRPENLVRASDQAANPPSTFQVMPVMNPASGLTR